MGKSTLVTDAVSKTIENNPELVEEYHNDVHGALNDLLAKLNERTDGCVPNTAAISEFREQLNPNN